MAQSFHGAWLDEFGASRARTVVELAALIAPLVIAWYRWSIKATPTEVFLWMLLAMVVVIFALVYHSSRIWKREHSEVERLQGGPKLRLVFDPNSQLFDSLHNDGKLRIFRVGVLNSGASAVDVAVKVARVHPPLPRVFPMQELQNTHEEDGISRFTVNRSDEPLVWVDVIYQHISVDDHEVHGERLGQQYVEIHRKDATWRMQFAFSKGGRELPVDVDEYLIWLAIDGAGAEGLRKIVLRRNDKGQYDMALAMFG